MITCEEFFAEFGDYLEGHVAPEVKQQLDLHMAQCRACYVLFDSARKTVRIVTDSSSFDLPPAATEAIIDRLMVKLRREQRGS